MGEYSLNPIRGRLTRLDRKAFETNFIPIVGSQYLFEQKFRHSWYKVYIMWQYRQVTLTFT